MGYSIGQYLQLFLVIMLVIGDVRVLHQSRLAFRNSKPGLPDGLFSNPNPKFG
jgi:hypothetical protein